MYIDPEKKSQMMLVSINKKLLDIQTFLQEI